MATLVKKSKYGLVRGSIGVVLFVIFFRKVGVLSLWRNVRFKVFGLKINAAYYGVSYTSLMNPRGFSYSLEPVFW